MKISFVIPAHDSAEYLPIAVDSCLSQTYKDIEIVIVDDASRDSTPDYLAWLGKQGHGDKVKIIRNETNLGRSASRNIGNLAATGEILAVLDADDISMPKRAELTHDRFVKGAVFVHGMAHKTDTVGRDLGMENTDVFNKEKAIEMLSAGIVHSTVAYSKDLARQYPYLDGDSARLGVDDFTIFLPMALAGIKFDYIPSALSVYRINDFGITAIRDTAETVKFKTGFLEGLLVKS